MAPLHLASQEGHDRIVQLLLDVEADPLSTDGQKYLPITTPLRRATPRAAGEKIDLNKQDRQGNTALHIAAKSGFDKFVKQIIELESNINIKNKAGNTPLMEAATKNRASCLLMLLHKGAKVDEVNKAKRSVLHIASDRRSGECMEYILKMVT
ncbi:putative ankyrin repeat-containing protein [Penaeus vannamei]|uniref:Putative ankyrin repeat-containing protein n=1 Tax=Penaeus vannamei TaxID=6689 RepID=A0A3R7N2T1_PENVA|nr:putative ankyrin repeat-containing protein [Penaeus vannamei]